PSSPKRDTTLGWSWLHQKTAFQALWAAILTCQSNKMSFNFLKSNGTSTHFSLPIKSTFKWWKLNTMDSSWLSAPAYWKQFSMDVLDISPTVIISASLTKERAFSSFKYLWILGPSV